MAKGKKIILPVLAMMCLTALAGCGNQQTDTRIAEIDAIYQLYVADAQAQGQTPKSYEEWLASVKGKDGVDGKTPYIGQNGNWWIGEVDTGVKAAGKDGKDGADGADGAKGDKGDKGDPGKDGADGADGEDGQDGAKGDKGDKGDPGQNGADGNTPYIGQNGNWWIGEVDTGVKAAGTDGADGEDGQDGVTPHIGENGNWFIGETDTGVKATGAAGVGIADIDVTYVTEDGATYAVYTFKMTDGSEIVKRVMVDHDHPNTTYKVKGFNEEKFVVLEANNPCTHCSLTNEIVTDTKAEANIKITGDGSDAAEYLTLSHTEANGFVWDAENQYYKSGINNVANGRSNIVFTASKACKLTFDFVTGGEGSSYDYASMTMSGGTMKFKGTDRGTSFSFSSVMVSNHAEGPVEVDFEAGGVFTMKFQNDGSVFKDIDDALMSNVLVTADDMVVTPDAYAAVNFETMGGSFVAPKAVKKGAKAVAPVNPTKDGKAFGGWYTNRTFIVPFNFETDAITKDTVVYAKWVEQVIVVTSVNGVETEYAAAYGQPFEIEDIQPGEGFLFRGWFTDPSFSEESRFVSGTPVTSNLMLYAKIDDIYGYSINKPYATSNLEAVEFDCNELTSRYFYIKFTAPSAGVYDFKLSDSVKVSGTGSKSEGLRVVNEDDVEQTGVSSSFSAAEQVKKYAYLTRWENSEMQVTLDEDEVVYIKFSMDGFSSSICYGTGKITITQLDAAKHQYYTAAAAYTLGTEASVTEADLPNNKFYWQKFTAPTSGTYTFETNTSSAPTCKTTLGYIDDNGAFQTVKDGNYGASTYFVTLEAEKEYYIASLSNKDGANTYHWKIYAGTPAGYEAASAIEITVDGAAVTNAYTAFAPVYYKFVVETDGYYKIASNKALYFYKNSSGWNSSDSTYVNVFAEEACSTFVVPETIGANTYSNGKEVLYNLVAGTYYIKASAYSGTSYNYTLAISSVADVTGYNIAHAIPMTVTAGKATYPVSDSTGVGTVYKFACPEAGKLAIKGLGADDKVGTKSTSYSMDYFSSTSLSTFGDLKYFVAEAEKEYFIFVKGADHADLEIETNVEIRDGSSWETAYAYTIGTEETTSGRVKGSRTYFEFTCAEAGLYLATVSQTSESYLMLYKSPSTSTKVTFQGSNGARLYTFEAGAKYQFYAYDCNFKFEKAPAGITFDTAIEITIAQADETVTLTNSAAAAGTYYKFVAPETSFYQMGTANTAVRLYVKSSSGSSLCTITSSGNYFKAVAGETYYFMISEVAKGTSVEFTIAHPANIEDGKTKDTPFVSATSVYEMKDTAYKSVFVKFAVSKNTEYVLYSLVDTGKDADVSKDNLYGGDGVKITPIFHDNDVSATDVDNTDPENVINIKEKTGCTSTNGCYIRFNSGENDYVIFSVSIYPAGVESTFTYNLKTLASFIA